MQAGKSNLSSVDLLRIDHTGTLCSAEKHYLSTKQLY